MNDRRFGFDEDIPPAGDGEAPDLELDLDAVGGDALEAEGLEGGAVADPQRPPLIEGRHVSTGPGSG